MRKVLSSFEVQWFYILIIYFIERKEGKINPFRTEKQATRQLHPDQLYLFEHVV